ncbi:MAG: hypothetical protein OEQ53_08600 [Saprospiraceae bacterium]|nr:hypothetical protein [Saprospiraceae bacterium]
MQSNSRLSIGFVFLLFACSTSQVAQSPVQQQIDYIEYTTATLDQLGNLYYCNQANEVQKFDPEGRQLGYYSNNQLGEIGLIDATSPLKVLVYYPAFHSGVILDRWMHETSRFNTIDLGFGEVEAMGLSKDGTLWLFDNQEQRLIKVDQQGNIILSGEDLRLLFNEQWNPVKLLESGNKIYMLVPSVGILVFDLFGNFQRQISDHHIKDLQIVGNNLLLQRDGDIEIYDTRNFISLRAEIPKEASVPSRLLLRGDEWVIVHDRGVQILKRK